jgi:hypothetical protein
MKTSMLVAGDVLALAVVTLVGFGSHGEFSAAFLPRMAAAFLPLCAGWFLLAPHLGLFERAVKPAASGLWRPGFVMLFAGPLAVVLRGLLLGSPIMPSFGVVLSITSALALTIWRGIWLLLQRRAAQAPA